MAKSLKPLHGIGATIAVLLLIAVSQSIGCGQSDSYQRLRRSALEAGSGEHSFESIAKTFNSLERGVELEVVSLERVLDQSLSRDQKPILAVMTDDPESDGAPFNLLQIVSENADFTQLRVRQGDYVNFVFQESIAPDINAGLTRQGTLEFRVLQVVDRTKLRVYPGLKAEWVTPTPIVIRRQSKRRHAAIKSRLESWERTGKPAIGWEPTPDEDSLGQLVGRLNQWLASHQASDRWSADPMVTALSPEERHAFGFDDDFAHLESLTFRPNDGRLIQEAIWLRDITRRAEGNNALEQFTSLFDWVVRNLQLETDKTISGIAQRPWQALASGRATATERAWVAILAARQLHLETVMLALKKEEATDGLRPWVVGLWYEDDLHLFDPTLGFPIGTLSALRADDDPLRRLDLDNTDRYPVQLADLSNVVALIEATPLYLSRRTKLVESQLAGAQRVVLSSTPSKLARLLKSHVRDVRLWKIARETESRQAQYSQSARSELVKLYETFATNPMLWKGRILQFKGDDHRIEEDEEKRLIRVYARNQDPRVYFLDYCRFPKSEFDSSQIPRQILAAMQVSNHNATYWMGQIAFEDGDYPVANDYFRNRTLEAYPKGPWTHGAQYNLARGHEGLAEFYQRLQREGPDAEIPEVLEDLVTKAQVLDKTLLRQRQTEHLRAARQLYENDASPQRHGNRLRAKRLLIPDDPK